MSKRRVSSLLLWGYSLVSLVLAFFFFVLWVVNLEEAVHLFYPNWGSFAMLLPTDTHTFCMRCSADLSTVSTLVPMLMFLFPAWQGFRALALVRRGDGAVLHWRPYPPHFAFFLIMLGLTGTLYGLLIGLQSSGVESVGAGEFSAVAVRDSVQRLLAGTATAVLSSLVGLIGAFLAARPLAWLFCRCLPLPVAEEIPESLDETVDRLSEGLGKMDRVVRAVTRSLEPVPFDSVVARLGELEAQNRQAVAAMTQLTTVMERCATALESVPDLAVVAADVGELKRAQERVRGILTEIRDGAMDGRDLQAKATETAGRAAAELERQTQQLDRLQNAAQSSLHAVGEGQQQQAEIQARVEAAVRELAAAVQASDEGRKSDRSVMRKAFAAFLDDQVG